MQPKEQEQLRKYIHNAWIYPPN